MWICWSFFVQMRDSRSMAIRSDSVRLGGAYELFHLAQDTEELRQTVLDILYAHIRRTTGERLDIPVIFTCRKDVLNQVHFDTRQYNHIVWEKPEELREKLAKRIAAVVGDGPFKENNSR